MTRGFLLSLTALCVVLFGVGTAFAFTPSISVPDVIIGDQTPVDGITPGDILTAADTLENQADTADVFDFPNAFNIFDLVEDKPDSGTGTGTPDESLTYNFISSPSSTYGFGTGVYTTDDRISINGTTVSASSLTDLSAAIVSASGEITFKDEVVSTDSGAETPVTVGTLTYTFGESPYHPTYVAPVSDPGPWTMVQPLIDANTLTLQVDNGTKAASQEFMVFTVDDGPDALTPTVLIGETVVDLSAWEFDPALVAAFGTYPGDTVTTARNADDNADGSIEDLAMGAAGTTGQAYMNWASPPDAVPFVDGATYRVLFSVDASGFASTAAVPQQRFRANYGFTGGLGAVDVVAPESDTVPPTIGGETTYALIFDELAVASANGTATVALGTPFDGMTSTENAMRLFYDWVDFVGSPLGGGTLELESVVIQQLNQGALLAMGANEQTITDFTQAVDVDLYGGALNTSPGSTMTVSFAAAEATITSTGTNTVGTITLWDTLGLLMDVEGVASLPIAPSNPGVETIYRAEIGVDTSGNTTDVPVIRVIMNAFSTAISSNTLATEYLINAVRGTVEGDGSASPALAASSFSSYLSLPSNQPTFGGTAGTQVQASLSLIDQDDPYICSGTVRVNAITIDAIPASALP